MLQVLIRVGNPLVEPPHRPKLPDYVPAFVRALCQRCWHPSPVHRPEFAKIADELDELPYEVMESTSLALREAREKRLPAPRDEKAQGSGAFPPHLQRKIDEGRAVKPSSIDEVSVVVVGVHLAPAASGSLSPAQVADVYDRVDSLLSAIAARHRLFRMETVDGSFMVCGNVLEQGESGDHCVRAALFALDAIREVAELQVVPGEADSGCVSVCAGFHAGPVTAIVTSRADSSSKQFSLIGETVNTAIRLEEHSEQMMVTLSMDAASILLRQAPDNSFRLSRRGSVRMQDRWPMELFWLLSPRRTAPGRTTGTGGGGDGGAKQAQQQQQPPQLLPAQPQRPVLDPWGVRADQLQVVVRP